ncbi:MAG: hypothetical protein ACXAC2_05780, partial [Candidatus Kariarchaeaceae archaeon]
TDVDMNNAPLCFTDDTWRDECMKSARSGGTLHRISGIDYFIFPKTMQLDMPPFVVGRPMWDNWMISKCLKLGAAVIDATMSICAIHPTHDFSHIEGGFDASRHGSDAQINRSQKAMIGTIKHCTWKYNQGKFVENPIGGI